MGVRAIPPTRRPRDRRKVAEGPLARLQATLIFRKLLDGLHGTDHVPPRSGTESQDRMHLTERFGTSGKFITTSMWIRQYAC